MKRWTLTVMVALMAFAPGIASAQTPVAATPTSGPGIEVTVLAETGELILASGSGTPAPMTPPVEHRLERVTMEPGFGFYTGVVMQSMLVSVESGNVLFSAPETAASVDVGSGQPILADDGETVLCERDSCIVEAGQEIVIGPGNSFAMIQDSLHVKTAGDEPAIFVMSSVFMTDDHLLCWICPTT